MKSYLPQLFSRRKTNPGLQKTSASPVHMRLGIWFANLERSWSKSSVPKVMFSEAEGFLPETWKTFKKYGTDVTQLVNFEQKYILTQFDSKVSSYPRSNDRRKVTGIHLGRSPVKAVLQMTGFSTKEE